MSEEVLYQVDRGIGILTVNRPEARNALNWSAQEQFAFNVESARGDDSLRALVITAIGEKAFVSGGDLKELGERPDSEAGQRLSRVMQKALKGLTELPVPVIVAVNGDAVGGGCEIVTACDLRVAAKQSRFRFAQVSVGLTTGWGGTARLVRLLGLSRALEYLLTGRRFDAQEAHRVGFVHRLAPNAASCRSVAMDWAEELKFLPGKALAAIKALAYFSAQESLELAYNKERDLFAEVWGTPDHIEAMAAFAERRLPNFRP